jgi:hypothetical protein
MEEVEAAVELQSLPLLLGSLVPTHPPQEAPTEAVGRVSSALKLSLDACLQDSHGEGGACPSQSRRRASERK